MEKIFSNKSDHKNRKKNIENQTPTGACEQKPQARKRFYVQALF